MTDPAPPDEPGPPRRRRLAVRVRTLLALVAAVAAGLWGWGEYRRREAVGALRALIPTGVSAGFTAPVGYVYDDARKDAVVRAVERVRVLFAEPKATAALVADLREARRRRDGEAAQAATFALTELGAAARPAVPDLIRTLREERGWMPRVRAGDPYADWDLVRVLAAHALRVVGRDDPDVLPALIAELAPVKDGASDKEVASFVAREVGTFGPEARGAVPALIALLRHPHQPGRVRAADALGQIGPDARPATPDLVAALDDPDADVRSGAAEALGLIGIPGELIPILEAYRDREADPLAGSAAELALRRLRFQVEVARNRRELWRQIAFDRALGGRPRPRTSTGD